jgi:hypothetical protein
MSSSERPNFDFSAREAEFARFADLEAKRRQALSSVATLWSSIRDANSRLTTTRRFIISAGANKVVPAAHERMLLIPKVRAGRVADVTYARVYTPLLPVTEGGEARLDNRYAFLGFKHATGETWRALLSEDEFSAYSNAQDIRVTEHDGEVTYSTRQPLPTQARLGRLSMGGAQVESPTAANGTESEALDTLLDLLAGYEPTPEGNQPLFRL